MPILTNPTKKKTSSILVSDLLSSSEFNFRQTLPASQLADDGLTAYLQYLGVADIDKEFNDAVKEFEVQLEEQEIASKMQANLAAESSANLAVESQPGLGTGAAAVNAEGRQNILADTHADIEAQVAETYASGLANMSENYMQRLESVLGKYDETTQSFAGLTDYLNIADTATEALLKALALLTNPEANIADESYQKVLKSAGLAIIDDQAGTVTLTEIGTQAIDKLLNSTGSNDERSELGGQTLLNFMAEQMAQSQYVLNTNKSWLDLDSEEQQLLITKQASWLYNNFPDLRVSSWGLYEEVNGRVMPDMTFSLPHVDAAGVVGDAISVAEFNINNVEAGTKTEAHILQMKADIGSGKIPNGSYITFAAGDVYGSDAFYYVQDGYIYKTEYTVDNPPPSIPIGGASIYSFGDYHDSGKGGEQDAWVQAIIDSARAGRIPDGTVFLFDISSVAAKFDRNKTAYEYSNGAFIKLTVDNSKKIIDGSQTAYIRPDKTVLETVAFGPTSPQARLYLDFDFDQYDINRRRNLARQETQTAMFITN